MYSTTPGNVIVSQEFQIRVMMGGCVSLYSLRSFSLVIFVARNKLFKERSGKGLEDETKPSPVVGKFQKMLHQKDRE